jgi:hypothetical protein
MNHPGRGKISRLPREVQEEVNRRLKDGEHGKTIVEWLNSLPSVCDVMEREFDGKPVREQNLSDWRKHGYRDWFAEQKTMELARRISAGEVPLQKHRGELTGNVALWLAARYSVAAQEFEKDNALDWKKLRELCSDLATLRRSDYAGARRTIDSQRQLLKSRIRKQL